AGSLLKLQCGHAGGEPLRVITPVLSTLCSAGRRLRAVQIVNHATIGRERLIDTSYALNGKCLRSVVETQACVYCESLVVRQIDAAECHRHGDAAIETFDVIIELSEVLINAVNL